MNTLNKVQAYIVDHVGSPVQHGPAGKDSPEGQHSGLQYAVMGLDARYVITYGIDDISLKGLWIVFCDGRWIGNAESLRDAQYAARIHASIFDGATLH